MKKILLLILAGSLIFSGVLLLYMKTKKPVIQFKYNEGTLELSGHTFRVTLADSEEERLQGLSHQKEIGKREALLFVFPVPDTYGIWMRDMNFPIDIVWLDSTFTVVDIKEAATPESFRSVTDAEVFTPRSPALYVLEAGAGFVKSLNLTIGETFIFKTSEQK